MRRNLLCVALLVLIASTARAMDQNDAAIWRPRLPTPALVALDSSSNREFTVELRASNQAAEWKVSLSNDLNSWPCEVVSAEYATINRGTEPGWQVRVRVPQDISPELFALKLTCSELSATQLQSVSVCPKFAEDFYILHLSDEQIVNDKHTDPAGTYLKMVGSQEEMHWMQDPINLIHPRFCLVTGDQIDYNGALDGWNNWPNWGYLPGAHKHFTEAETIEIEKRLSEMYLECHRGYRVPYVETPGNHDVTPADKKRFDTPQLWHPISVKNYESYFGQRSWSFRMGDFYVLMHDWTENDLKKWAAADYEKSIADPTIKYRIMGQHYNTDQAFNPAECNLMLIGHGHRVKTIRQDPYFVYEDGPTFRYGVAGFFNFRRNDSGWTCDQTNGERDVKKDVLTLFTDNGVEKKVRTDQGDPMNIHIRSVTITNDLPQRFYDGRLRFVLPEGAGASVKNGTVLSQYKCSSGNAGEEAVLVKVDIPANGSVTVSIGDAK